MTQEIDLGEPDLCPECGRPYQVRKTFTHHAVSWCDEPTHARYIHRTEQVGGELIKITASCEEDLR